MPRTCTKEFTVTIVEPASAVTLFAYYQCEASPAVDLHGGRNLTPDSTLPTIAAGIIGNSFQAHTVGGWFMRAAASADWDFAGQDFSIRFWHYLPNTTPVSFTTQIGTAVFGFVYGNGPSGHGYYFRTQDAFAVWRYVYDIDTFAIGWHYIAATMGGAAGPMQIKVDNRPIVTGLAGILPMRSIATPHFVATGNFADLAWRQDEIAIWKGILSEAEMIADYNAGVGKTYPNVPGI